MDRDQFNRCRQRLGSHLWRHAHEDRLFLIPESTHLPKGEFPLRTLLGQEQSVDEAAVLPFEIPDDQRDAILKEEFGRVLEEGRERLLESIASWGRKARELPPGVEAVPQERREAIAGALDGLAGFLERLTESGARRLREAARDVRAEPADTADSADATVTVERANS